MDPLKIIALLVGREGRLDVRVYVIEKIVQRQQVHQQRQKNDTFYQPTDSNAQCIRGSRKYPETGKSFFCEKESFCSRIRGNCRFFSDSWLL